MRATVIKAPAGFGKTQLCAKKAAESKSAVIEFYVPTHVLAEEIRASILNFNPKKRVVVMRGRSFIDTGGQPLCLKSAVANQLSKSGFPVFPNLCYQTGKKPNPPSICSHFSSCGYIAQFKPADVYIYTHSHLPLARSMLEPWQPSTVIIDEAFYSSCIKDFKFNISLLTHPDLPTVAQPLCRDIANGMRAGSWPQIELRMLAATRKSKEYLRAMSALKKPKTILDPTISFPSQAVAGAQIISQVNFAPVRVLLHHIETKQANGIEPVAVDFDQESGDIVVHHRLKITRFNRPNRLQPAIYILDATASKKIIGQFFDVQNVREMPTERQARVIQCSSTRCSTKSLVPTRNRSAKKKADARRKLNEITKLLADLSATGQKLLVVGPSVVVGNPRTGAKSLITIPANCEAAHFGALRGIDRWKDVDTVVVIGRNQPPIKALESVARALFYDDPKPLVLYGTWGTQKRGYYMQDATQRPGVDVDVHADARVQAVVEQIRERETIQAVDRARLVHATFRKTVILLSNIPVDIPVDELLTWDEIMNGIRLEQAWEGVDGVLPLSPAWLTVAFPALWQTAAAAKQDVLKFFKKYATPNSIYIGSSILFKFQYKAACQRRWSTCLTDAADARTAKEKLTVLLGKTVTARVMPAQS